MAVLGVPVVCYLHGPAMAQELVVHHGRLDAQDRLRPVGHLDVLDDSLALLDAPVAVLAAGLQGKPRIVDAGDEVARAERGWPPRSGPRLDRPRRLAALGRR